MVVLCGGCSLPLSTGAPMSATTVGAHHLGLAVSAEAPVVDSTARIEPGFRRFQRSIYDAPRGDHDGHGELRAWRRHGSRGGVEAFTVLPIGLSLGVRRHLGATDDLDFAVAGRVAGLAIHGSTFANDTATSNSATAVYGSVQAIVQRRYGRVRPLLAAELLAYRATRNIVDGGPNERLEGLAPSVTLAVILVGRWVQGGPYATVTRIESDTYPGVWSVSGGLMFALRPDRNR